MSLPIALGAKSVSSRPLVSIRDDAQTDQEHKEYFAEDGITGLFPVQIPDSVPLTATAICPLQEWLAVVTIEYFDMLLVVDHGEDDSYTQTTDSGRRRQFARHSTVAEVRIQISPLSLPFSSAYRNILHRLTLPLFEIGYLDEDLVDRVCSRVQPSLVFSSDRRRLACLIPYLRGHQSALVAFDLKRPLQNLRPRRRPKLPAYIPTPSEERRPQTIPEARDHPQWLTLPPGGTALDIQHTADYWLHNITSIRNASTGKGSSVLLAGCRDGSILGISFRPLLLAGRLYHPSDPVPNLSRSITFLSHITTSPTDSEVSDGVVGRLVALEETGKALVFQTRMILSSLTNEDNDLENVSTSMFRPDDSTSTFQPLDMDATDYSAAPTNAIHAESFNVVKTGARRHSLPANSRLAEETEPLIQQPYQLSPSKFQHTSNNNPLGNTGVLMFLEPLSEYVGRFCRAQWISGALLALLETPLTRKEDPNNNTRSRVAQVVGVLPNRPLQVLTELTLTLDDLEEHSHTTFSLNDDDDHGEDDNVFPLDATNSLLTGNDTSALEASLGIQHDPYSGCLAISSASMLDGTTPTPHSRVFVCLWNWRCNVLGFTAVATTCSSPKRPLSRLLFTKERHTNLRQLAHLRCAGGDGEVDRIRKDLYQVGTLSPSHDVRRTCGSELHPASPLQLTSTSVTFALASQPSRKTCEVEWRECAVPMSYRLEYGSPSIAAVSSSGQSIAVASSRGLCVLECEPRAKKFTVGKERGHLFEETQEVESEREGLRNRRGSLLPPKWHYFGNEKEEKAFRVLTMTWWRGESDLKRSHASDDLLVAVIQIQRQEDKEADPPGTCYLACWSQRRLDGAHQRLRPLDDNLRSSRSQWGVRLPDDFRVKSLDLLEQPVSSRGSNGQGKQIGRKALVLLSSLAGPNGAVEFLVFQLQVIQSIGRTQSSESYQEHRPFSVLSKQCSRGLIDCSVDGSLISSIFLASASFQFDLRQRRNRKSTQENPVSEIVGTLGVVHTPGGGLEAVAITSSGPSKNAAIVNSQLGGHTLLDVKKEMKSSEISSYWLSDLILGQRPISTNFGGNATIDFFVWTFQLADGKVFCWFVPCLEFPQVRSELGDGGSSPALFSSSVMLGLVCPVGTSTTWLRPSPAKTGRDFMIGCMPHSTHGCVLTTGQTSRKFHRTIAGDFDHSLFASDFLEHELLYPRDFELSPPAFISSIAALLRSKAFLVASSGGSADKVLRAQNPNWCPVNAGGDDVEKAVLAINASAHTQMRSRRHQDAAFMALRLLLLRSTEQLTDDIRKHRALPADEKPVLSSSVLAEVLHVVKNCSSSRLQFASLVLEVGRQLEPSCFPNLFPLRTPQHNHAREKNGETAAPSSRWDDMRVVNDVFRTCLEDGSLLCSVSTLPIIPGSSMARENSMLLLEHCADVYMKNGSVESDFFFDYSTEERSMMRDIFRFGAKLEDSGSADETDDDAMSVVSSSGSSHSSADDVDEYSSRRQGYSLACGMLNLSWFSSKPNPSQQNLHGERKKSSQGESERLLQSRKSGYQRGRTENGKVPNDEDPSNLGTVAGSVALLLTTLAIPNDEQLEKPYAWKRSSALAFLVLGQEESLLPKLAATDCTSLAKSAVAGGIGDQQGSRAEDGLAELLIRCMISCSSEIGIIAAGRLLDLVLILLERTRHSSDLDATLPGLLVIGIATGHLASRVNEILDVEDKSIAFSRCYWAAKEKFESLHSL